MSQEGRQLASSFFEFNQYKQINRRYATWSPPESKCMHEATAYVAQTYV